MKWFQYVIPGSRIPRGYGIAWHAFDRNAGVAMPLPLNLFAGAARRLYYWAAKGVDPSHLEMLEDQVHTLREREKLFTKEKAELVNRAEFAERRLFQLIAALRKGPDHLPLEELERLFAKESSFADRG